MFALRYYYTSWNNNHYYSGKWLLGFSQLAQWMLMSEWYMVYGKELSRIIVILWFRSISEESGWLSFLRNGMEIWNVWILYHFRARTACVRIFHQFGRWAQAISFSVPPYSHEPDTRGSRNNVTLGLKTNVKSSHDATFHPRHWCWGLWLLFPQYLTPN